MIYQKNWQVIRWNGTTSVSGESDLGTRLGLCESLSMRAIPTSGCDSSEGEVAVRSGLGETSICVSGEQATGDSSYTEYGDFHE